MHQVRDFLSLHHNSTGGRLNYDNYPHKANKSIERANVVKRARTMTRGDSAARRERTSMPYMRTSQGPGVLEGPPRSYRRQEKGGSGAPHHQNQHLTKALPKIKEAHQVLTSVDHEVKDFEQEKHNLRAKRDADREQTKKQFAEQIKPLEERSRNLKRSKASTRGPSAETHNPPAASPVIRQNQAQPSGIRSRRRACPRPGVDRGFRIVGGQRHW